MIWNAVNESKPEVGSSRRMQLGFVTNSKPIEALFLSPPDMPLNETPPIKAF